MNSFSTYSYIDTRSNNPREFESLPKVLILGLPNLLVWWTTSFIMFMARTLVGLKKFNVLTTLLSPEIFIELGILPPFPILRMIRSQPQAPDPYVCTGLVRLLQSSTSFVLLISSRIGLRTLVLRLVGCYHNCYSVNVKFGLIVSLLILYSTLSLNHGSEFDPLCSVTIHINTAFILTKMNFVSITL